MAIHDFCVVAGRLFVGECIEIAADRIHRFGDLACRAPLRSFEEHVFDEVGDPALFTAFGRRTDIRPDAERNGAYRFHSLADDPHAAGKNGFPIRHQPLGSKVVRAHSWSRYTSSRFSRRSARFARSLLSTLAEKTVRAVGCAKGPLTISPGCTRTGTIAQTSVSSMRRSAANVPRISAATSSRNAA